MKKSVSLFLIILIILSTSAIAASAVTENPVANIPKLSAANNLKLTSDLPTDGFSYQVYNGSRKVASGNVAAKDSKASVKLNFKVGTIYKTRARTYTFSKGVKNYGKWSEYTYISPAPTVTYKWSNKGLKISWSEVKKASYYNLKVERTNNSNISVKYTNLNTNSYTVPFSALPFMNVNKTYKISVAPYKDDVKTNTGTVTTTDIEICGHRGAMDIAPQNTLISFQKAGEIGYDSIEADYWETKSGDLLILHDSTLKMCNKPEIDVRTLTEKKLRNYPIKKGPNVKQYDTQYIPTLNELVKLAAKSNLKLYLHTKNSNITDAGLKKVYKTINKHGMKNKTIVFSSNKTACKRIVKQGICAGYLIFPKSKADITSGVNYTKSVKAKVLICQHNEFMTSSGVKYAHKSKIKVGCYDVSDQTTASKFTNTGADFLITNNDFINTYEDVR